MKQNSARGKGCTELVYFSKVSRVPYEMLFHWFAANACFKLNLLMTETGNNFGKITHSFDEVIFKVVARSLSNLYVFSRIGY